MENDRGHLAGARYRLVLFFLQLYVRRIRGHGQFSHHLFPRSIWTVKSARWRRHDHRGPCGKFSAAGGRMAFGQDRRLPLAVDAVDWRGRLPRRYWEAPCAHSGSDAFVSRHGNDGHGEWSRVSALASAISRTRRDSHWIGRRGRRPGRVFLAFSSWSHQAADWAVFGGAIPFRWCLLCRRFDLVAARHEVACELARRIGGTGRNFLVPGSCGNSDGRTRRMKRALASLSFLLEEL